MVSRKRHISFLSRFVPNKKIDQMKKLFILLMVVVFAACQNDDGPPAFEGSQADLTDLFNEEVVEALTTLNFTINQGNNPPNLEGTFLMTPLISTDSNVPGDAIGAQFFDQRYTFLNQNNSTNTIDFMGQQLEPDGRVQSVLNGDGSFISGTDNAFSIFLTITNEDLDTGGRASVAYCISGTIMEDGIRDIELAIIVLDDFGDEFNQFIEIGQGRRFIDTDGFSPRTTNEAALSSREVFMGQRLLSVVQSASINQ